jgi:hypothetical protein
MAYVVMGYLKNTYYLPILQFNFVARATGSVFE